MDFAVMAGLAENMKKVGFLDCDIRRISLEQLANLRAVVSGTAVMRVEHIIDLDRVLRDENQTVYHQKQGMFVWDSSKVSLVQIVQRMTLDEIQAHYSPRMLAHSNLRDYLLKYPHLIPSDWDIEEKVYFGGTYFIESLAAFISGMKRNDGQWECFVEMFSRDDKFAGCFAMISLS